MTQIMQPYAVNNFNDIADLQSSNASLSTRAGPDFVGTALKAVLLKHKVESVLSIGLLHRHLTLYGAEKAVEFNNVSTPWDDVEDENAQINGGIIIPAAWLIVKSANGAPLLMPYEFSFSPLGLDHGVDLSAPSFAPFMKDFVDTVMAAGTESVLVLRAFPHAGYSGGLELTQGHANIVLRPDQLPNQDWMKGGTETAWFFDPAW